VGSDSPRTFFWTYGNTMAGGFFDLRYCENITLDGIQGYGFDNLIRASNTTGLVARNIKGENCKTVSTLLNNSDAKFKGLSGVNCESLIRKDSSSRAEVEGYEASNVRAPFESVDNAGNVRKNQEVDNNAVCASMSDQRETETSKLGTSLVTGWSAKYEDGIRGIDWDARHLSQ
jgi:hypothetical protein